MNQSARQDGRCLLSTASDLLERHIRTLVADPAQWRTLITDDIVWELAYAPAIGHPARLTGRAEVTRHVDWFLSAVENFRFIEPKVTPSSIPRRRWRKSGRKPRSSRPGASTARSTWCSCASRARRSHLREYFDPTRASNSMNAPILDLEPWF